MYTCFGLIPSCAYCQVSITGTAELADTYAIAHLSPLVFRGALKAPHMGHQQHHWAGVRCPPGSARGLTAAEGHWLRNLLSDTGLAGWQRVK